MPKSLMYICLFLHLEIERGSKKDYKHMRLRLAGCWVAVLIVIFSISGISQEVDSLENKLSVDSTSIEFEKILLDGIVSYRNTQTGEIMDQMDYIRLHDSTGNAQDLMMHHNHDYWVSDRINPYRDVKTPTPFKISFDQMTFTHPVDGDIVITSRFGRRRRGPHGGLDIDLVTGDNVRSVLPGQVRFVGYSSGHGKTVVVRHANEVETVYAHLSAYDVSVNDWVSEGAILGKGGNTGRSRGSHLHIEVRYKGIAIHPEYVFNFDGSRTIRGSELWVTNGWKTPRYHSSYMQSEIVPLYTKEAAIVAEKEEPRFHRVRRGNTLSHISRIYRVSVSELCKMNAISRNSTLRIGQILKVR